MKRLIAFAATALLGSVPALARWEYKRYGKDFIIKNAGNPPSSEYRRAATNNFRKNMG